MIFTVSWRQTFIATASLTNRQRWRELLREGVFVTIYSPLSAVIIVPTGELFQKAPEGRPFLFVFKNLSRLKLLKFNVQIKYHWY
jgi:hypothetical protein